MQILKEYTVESFLREQLLELALTTKNKILFERMMGEDWEKHIVQERKKPLNPHIFKIKKEEQPSFLETDYFENFNCTMPDLDEYIEMTTIADVYEDKKKHLHQLLMLSKKMNQELFDFLTVLNNDAESVHLLTLITDKTYRNSVFYISDEIDALSVKDKRENIALCSVLEALEFYRNNNIPFFIEIPSYKK